MQAQKLIASALHLIFLTVMFAGIGTMYLNDNFGIGITRVQNTVYEDTDEFTRQFNRDLNDIFQYIEYNPTFGERRRNRRLKEDAPDDLRSKRDGELQPG